MSIISDALARLQSERGSSKNRAVEGSEESHSVDHSPGSSSSQKSFPRKGMVPSRRWVIGLISALLLFGLGLGSFWWGLNLGSDVPQVMNTPDPPSQVAALPPPETTEGMTAEGEDRDVALAVDTPNEVVDGSEEAMPDIPSAVQESDSVRTPQLEGKPGPGKTSARSTVLEGHTTSSLEKKTDRSPKKTIPSGTKNVAGVSPPHGKLNSRVSSVSDTPPNNVQAGNKKAMNKTGSPAPSTPSSLGSPARPKRVLSKEQRLVLAQRLIKKRRYDLAVIVLGTVMTSSPEEWEPWFWMGTAKLGQGNIEEADAYFIEGLARNGTIPQLWVQRALVGQQEGRYGEAIDFLRQAEILAPDLPEISLNLAYSFETQGNRQLAIQHYRKFLTMTEGNSSYRSARKTVLIRVDHLNHT